MSDLNNFLGGAIAAGYAVAALFFLKFYIRTKDRLFILFCVALLMLGSTRVWMVLVDDPNESHYLYLLRLLAYVLILGAIIDKNLPRRSRASAE
jgi:hypothetical protein